MNISQLATGSVVISILAIIFTTIISIYSLYLNWKQSKVKNQMDKLIKILEDIRFILQEEIFKK